MNYILGPPSVKRLSTSVGVDSVYLQIKGINKFDVDRFCSNVGLEAKKTKGDDYQRKWKINLTGDQSITVTYHLRWKTVTFQIGRLMNYSINGSQQHRFAQDLMRYFSNRPVVVARVDFAIDVRKPMGPFFGSHREEVSTKESTVYYNHPYQTVFTVYDKAEQIGLYSTPLTRFELRLKYKMAQWKVKDFVNNPISLTKLAHKIDQELAKSLATYAEDTRSSFILSPYDTVEVLQNFVGFLHGGAIAPIKCSDITRKAISSRDVFLMWMKRHKIKSPDAIKGYLKKNGGLAVALSETGLSSKTFNKALEFYKSIPDLKSFKKLLKAYRNEK